MHFKSIVAAALLIPASVSAADETASTQQQQYLEHMNRILELVKEQQRRCLNAKSVDECTASDEFTEMVDKMYQSMLTNPGEWPEDYFESLKRGESPMSMEEMIEQYRRGSPSPEDKGKKTTESEAI